MPVTGFKQRKTPGVYVTELDAFPPSIVGVQTAVPAFIGYTEKAEISGKPVYMKPIKIRSLADYEAIFGAGFKPLYNITDAGTPAKPDDYDFKVPGVGDTPAKYYKLEQTSESSFFLFHSLRLFFENGGETSYIVSVGNYTNNGETPGGVKIDAGKLQEGLAVIGEQVGPTMLVIPDAALIDDETKFGGLAVGMLKQCGELQDRVAILDVWGAEKLHQEDPTTFNKAFEDTIEKFRTAVSDKFLSYGMAYFPFLNTSVVQANEFDYTDYDEATLKTVLKEEVAYLYQDDTKTKDAIDKIIDDEIGPKPTPEETRALNQKLVNAIPLLQQMFNICAGKMNLLPASGAMAGIYTFIDQTRGVWNAPANTSLTSVVSPNVNLTDQQQGDLNVPLNGKAIDALREFVGQGTVVWGARTLDGNSQDWRYVQVRRTIIYIEQSIKTALRQFVFAANDGKTWVAVVSMVSNFLQRLWSQGGLMGATASEAFTVECGLGSTMTAQDILDGYMIVEVTLQMIRPAEFIELTFKQKMEG